MAPCYDSLHAQISWSPQCRQRTWSGGPKQAVTSTSVGCAAEAASCRSPCMLINLHHQNHAVMECPFHSVSLNLKFTVSSRRQSLALKCRDPRVSPSADHPFYWSVQGRGNMLGQRAHRTAEEKQLLRTHAGDAAAQPQHPCSIIIPHCHWPLKQQQRHYPNLKTFPVLPTLTRVPMPLPQRHGLRC